MVQKHFAIFGSTGSGKSSAVALILREIMAARMDLRILLIDPHNEYGASFEDKAHAGAARQSAAAVLAVQLRRDRRGDLRPAAGRRWTRSACSSELIPLAKNDYARSRSGDRTSYRQIEPDGGRYTVDTPVPYRMEDLIALADSRMGKLENRAAARATCG